MVWLHFHSLFALSKACSTLVFVPYIKNTAVLQTQKDTSLFTRQKAVERHCSMLLLQLRYTWKTRFITLAPHAEHRLAVAGLQSCVALAGNTARLPRVPAPGLTAPLCIWGLQLLPVLLRGQENTSQSIAGSSLTL